MSLSSLAAAPAAVEPVGDPTVAPSRLLIVDDVADNRIVLARRFQRRNFEITEADCGHAALDLIERRSFDAVLLDIMMPDITGIEALRRIRQKYTQSKLPVIMVTANSRSDDIVQALEFGANDYVTKPVDFAVALARVNTQVERKRASDALEVMNAELHRTNLNLEGRVNERTARLSEANRQLQEEIAHRQKSDARSHYLAYHDALTGLANRVLFREDLERALQEARNARSSLAVLFIDLDGFKSVNDTFDHAVGDRVLALIAERLRRAFRSEDVVARYGGDEFVVILPEADLQSAAAAAERARVSLAGITIAASKGVACSIGVAQWHPSMSVDRLLDACDEALLAGKRAGKRRVTLARRPS